MALLEKKHVHVVAIGGIGVSALTKILMSRFVQITGSDAEESPLTQDMQARGARITIGHAADNVPVEAEALVYSSAVPHDNPERAEARRRGIPEFSYSEALGELTRGYRTLAVSGTHGKSTTTAMLGTILIKAGLSPLVLVGTRVSSFSDGNAHIGHGEFFVVEACEHEAQMMNLSPERIIVNNLEPDHLDFYHTFERLQETFRAYVGKVPAAQCVINFDDPAVKGLFADPHVPRSFGFTGGTVQCVERRTESGAQHATLTDASGNVFELMLAIPGAINVMNAMAAFEMARSIGVEPQVALDALSEYSGSWRRFERVGAYNGAPVISDYGHHPTALRETVKATKEFFPDKRILLVYQPHQHHRTKALYRDFVEALVEPDALIINEIYDVKGRESDEDQDVSSRGLYDEVLPQRMGKEQWYAASHDEVLALVREHAGPQDVILVMGAGDIYKVAHALCSK